MNGCPAMALDAESLAVTLRGIDCTVGQGTAMAFGRLFGTHGALLPALTGLLTIYVALFGFGLLTGRARLGLASLTPRMVTLGLVMTFATSWLAYEHVVWQLAVGAPDQIASIVSGTRGSATSAFADKIELVYSAIADSTHQSAQGAAAAVNASADGASNTRNGVSLISPQGMLWISGLMLLVGTVGVLVTAKVVLAALLALGPVFIVMMLFTPTRGLFEGWIKALVASALVPMFTVQIGGAMLSMIAPLIRDALMESTEEAARSATSLFLAACVYLALMVMLARVAGMIVGGWRLPWPGRDAAQPLGAQAIAPPLPAAVPIAPLASRQAASERVRAMMAALPANADAAGAADGPTSGARARAVVVGMAPATTLPIASVADRRLQGVGSRFRPRPDSPTPNSSAKARL